MIPLIENQATNFKSLKPFKEFIAEQESTKEHQLIEFKDWKLVDSGLQIKKETYPLRDSGMRTLLRTFSMPRDFYYKKSPTDMLVRDINRMKEEYTDDSQMLIFLQNKEVRAVSRPNFRPIPIMNILDSSDLPKRTFEAGNYSDYGVRVITADETRQIKIAKGDIMNIGLDLVYSDIGFHPLAGSPYLNRLVCENGMVAKEKSPFLNAFTMNFGTASSENEFLKRLHENINSVTINTEKLRETFKVMKDNPIKALPLGERQMEKMRAVIGTREFNEQDKLTVKILDTTNDKERRVINTDLELYSALDITTRLAKKYEYLTKRKIETLAGGLVVMCSHELLN